jgi:hypothetical protein
MTFEEKLLTSQPPIELDRPWIGCVWELSPLHHERNAWVRHILTGDSPDLDGYVADSMPSGHTR